MAFKSNEPIPPMIQKVFSIIISVAMAISGYFLQDCYKRLTDLEGHITEIEIDTAKTSGSRFTSNDWVVAKANIDSQIIAADKRILILEENNKAVKELLFEIRGDIKELKEHNQ